jgi:RNA polymerase sigma-70 factor (ECF subfamily)
MDLSDPSTFARVFDEHRRGVHATAYRVLGDAGQAQDVVQDVFLRVWRNPARFDARRGELGSYLRLMARSRAVDLWREGQAAGRAGDRLKVAVAQAEPERRPRRPDEVAIEGADRATVRAALRALPEPQREAIVLAYWGGLTADQVAVRAGVPLGTAKSRIRLGLARLRSELAAVRPDRDAVAA